MQPAVDMVNEQIYAGDDRLFVRFYMRSVQNEAKSNEAGHPVFDDTPFIKILVPGDKHTQIDTPVTPHYQQRFARLWAAFKNQQEQKIEGWSLDEWPAITRGQADELKYLNVFTVEQLAGMADVHGTHVMGFAQLKAKAQAALAVAKDHAAAQQLALQNRDLQIQIDALQEQLKTMMARYEQVIGNAQQNAAGGSAGRRS